jgi:hypothetical protein
LKDYLFSTRANTPIINWGYLFGWDDNRTFDTLLQKGGFFFIFSLKVGGYQCWPVLDFYEEPPASVLRKNYNGSSFRPTLPLLARLRIH